jgi:hypothetical protein
VKELAPFLIELHPIPHEPGAHSRISDWQRLVRGIAAISQPVGP